MAGPSFETDRDSNAVDNLPEMDFGQASMPSKGGPAMNPEAVNNVMYSDIGINVLLNRLKQSIASARDFSSFLSKRARLEDEHAQGLKKLSRATLDSVKRQDGRQGSYASQFASVCGSHDRMADHGIQFANSLHQMHTDVDDLTARIERERKHWKQEGLNSEKKVKDAESALEKAKSRYDSLATDYHEAKTGGSQSGRVFTVKGPKSAEKREEDLSRKLQAADQDYQGKVQAAQSTRQENLHSWRPQAIKALQEAIRECDMATTLQLQKFAAFNEKLLVGNGLEVSPLKPESDPSRALSMREMISQIDNERDFHHYIGSHANNVPSAPAEIAYQKHPTLGPTQQAPQAPQTQRTFQNSSADKRSSLTQSPQMTQSPSGFSPSVPQGSSFATSQNAYSQPKPPPTQAQAPPRAMTQSPPSGAYNTSPASTMGPAGYQNSRQAAAPESSFRGPSQQAQGQVQPGPAPNGSYSSAGPYRDQREPSHGYSQSSGGGLGMGGSVVGTGAANGAFNANPSSTAREARSHPPPTRPVFGQSLDALFRRDDTAVPYVVYQCIQAVDLFGLDDEGIYRMSGNSTHIAELKAVFDNDSHQPDFRNPSAFHHDINSVATLLKQFFRDLPDPLFTREHYASFIDAARIDDDNVRRDSVHAVINGLPDPNYATLRALVLHLNRVVERSDVNRMGSHNLAVVFAPTLMGQHTGPMMADAGLQARVVDTILKNTYQIFDDDE